jgi:protoporphyrinogen oxidase
MNRIAIIGSGITGLSIAYHAQKINPSLMFTLFDKSRRPGGRLTTRTTRNHPKHFFDHSMPFLDPKHLST